MNSPLKSPETPMENPEILEETPQNFSVTHCNAINHLLEPPLEAPYNPRNSPETPA